MDTSAAPSASDFLAVFRDRQTYRNLLFLLVAIPLGFVYYLLLALGFVLGVVLSIVLVGVPILFATILVARLLADLERRLANALLGTSIDPPDDLPSPSDDGIVATAVALLRSGTTWRGIGFLVLKSFVGFLTWLFVLVAGLTALVLLLAPLGGTATIFELWTIDTLAERLIAIPLGLSLVVAATHVLNAIAGVSRTLAVSLLATADDSANEGSGPDSDTGPDSPADDTDTQLTS